MHQTWKACPQGRTVHWLQEREEAQMQHCSSPSPSPSVPSGESLPASPSISLSSSSSLSYRNRMCSPLLIQLFLCVHPLRYDKGVRETDLVTIIYKKTTRQTHISYYFFFVHNYIQLSNHCRAPHYPPQEKKSQNAFIWLRYHERR